MVIIAWVTALKDFWGLRVETTISCVMAMKNTMQFLGPSGGERVSLSHCKVIDCCDYGCFCVKNWRTAGTMFAVLEAR